MSRLATALLIIAGILIGGLAAALVIRPGLDEAQVRQIAEQVLTERAADLPPALDEAAVREIADGVVTSAMAESADTAPMSQPIDAAALNPMIESYLLENPKVLQRASAALNEQIRAEETAERQAALSDLQTAIYEDPDHIVLGNPDGDVTLVEMFDYNCTYCRQALPDLATLIAEDPQLRVILKEFPILGPDSIDAARVAAVVGQSDVDYWAFHQALFSSRGKIDKAAAVKAASDLGLSPVSVQLEMEDADITEILQRSFQIADRLQISGTPTFIIGDEVIPGAVGLEGLRQRVDNMRACGATTCPAQENAPG
ncbi:DsbA family protein [Devosia sp.]|uniref:DsbA family protein n=1 Tax=Devosia sp. TaxID=1871048 RepID=UPI003A91A5FB